jgi:hypothetical protein
LCFCRTLSNLDIHVGHGIPGNWVSELYQSSRNRDRLTLTEDETTFYLKFDDFKIQQFVLRSP